MHPDASIFKAKALSSWAALALCALLTSVIPARAEMVRYAIAGEFIHNAGQSPNPYAGSFIGEFDFDIAASCGDEGRLTQWSIHATDDPTSSLTAVHYSSGNGGFGRWTRGCGTFYTFLVADPVTERGFQFSIVFDDGGQDNFYGGVDEIPFRGSQFDDPVDPRVTSRFVGSPSRVWQIPEPASHVLLVSALIVGWQVRSRRHRCGAASQRSEPQLASVAPVA